MFLDDPHQIFLGERIKVNATALGAVVARLPSITDVDQDPTEVIATGDWVKVDADNGIIEITKK